MIGDRGLSDQGKTLVAAFAAVCLITGGSVGVVHLTSQPETIQNEETGSSEKVQSTNTISRTVGEIEYTIYNGLVVEDIPTIRGLSVDKRVYDFHLRSIEHEGRTTEAGTTVIPFNQLANSQGELPEHIDYVRAIACEIAQEYKDRENSDEFGVIPEDVSLFRDRHCGLEVD